MCRAAARIVERLVEKQCRPAGRARCNDHRLGLGGAAIDLLSAAALAGKLALHCPVSGIAYGVQPVPDTRLPHR
ncbi:hypothetical protein D3C84_1218440 [compost metagenome]